MQMIDGFKRLVAGSLSLAEPWHIKGIEIDAEKMQVHIHVAFVLGQGSILASLGQKLRL